MPTYIVTGATRGLGYSIAANIAKSPNAEVVLAVRDLVRGNLATSKFLNMVSTVELSRRINPDAINFYCLDPGLMPGTGLARTSPSHLRFAWKYILPVISRMMPDTSTTQKSGWAGAWLMTTDNRSLNNGGIYSYDRKFSGRVWEKVFDPDVGRSVIDESLELLGFDRNFLNTIEQGGAGGSE